VPQRFWYSGGRVDLRGVEQYITDCIAIAEWCGGRSYMMHTGYEPNYYYDGDPGFDHILVPTAEGDQLARQGDWIVCDLMGGFFPCRAEAFGRLYESCENVDG
jgi:hypothetical protein